ncbi:hypothetical protein cypCar_00044583 [Cyprinus carpio]|nr:hypothetical protein cypCar_00044583 [Cyprinus carpio]
MNWADDYMCEILQEGRSLEEYVDEFFSLIPLLLIKQERKAGRKLLIVTMSAKRRVRLLALADATDSQLCSLARSFALEMNKVMPNSVCLLDPPDIMLNPVEGPYTVEEDEETVSVCSRRPEQDADTLLEPSQSGTTCDQNPENIKGVYKRYLRKQMEAIDTDMQYKKSQDKEVGAGNPTA